MSQVSCWERLMSFYQTAVLTAILTGRLIQGMQRIQKNDKHFNSGDMLSQDMYGYLLVRSHL